MLRLNMCVRGPCIQVEEACAVVTYAASHQVQQLQLGPQWNRVLSMDKVKVNKTWIQVWEVDVASVIIQELKLNAL